MSDNEDLLGDDLGDHSLADYNLGNEEEEQLLADDYESGPSQNVPLSLSGFEDVREMVPREYSHHEMAYSSQPIQYQMPLEPECVVPNITVEVPSVPIPDHSTYAPYEPPPNTYEVELGVVPAAIPSSPLESPQIVPSDMPPALNDMGGPRERFISERPPGAQRLPQIRDIPDSLDKVVVPRGAGMPLRGRMSWQRAHYAPRYQPPPSQYRRNNMHRANFNQRPSFPPPPQMRPNHPQMRPEFRPNHPQIRPEMRPEIRPDLPPHMGPEMSPERPINVPPEFQMERPFQNRFEFRPNLDPRPMFRPMRPNFDRPMFQQRPTFNPRHFGPPIREVVPNSVNHMPQVIIRHRMPMPQGHMPNAGPLMPNAGPLMPNAGPLMPNAGPQKPMEPEVRMLPVQLPPNLPPGGLAGKKVLINPHFKGNFQPPVDGAAVSLPLPAYIPTRIQKSPPLSPTLDGRFGPIKDIDDAAERFIAEQRSALARAAARSLPRRSPQRYIENTTIEIVNEFASTSPAPPPDTLADDDLLRRQEEFINANRAGLRRRMRSATPPRRSPTPPPRRSPPRPRAAPRAPAASDEDGEYKRRMREQESLRERVLRAKEVRRRKNAAAHRDTLDRERDRLAKEKEQIKPSPRVEPEPPAPVPDTTRKTPERERMERQRSPVRREETEVNSTCENLTPPRQDLPKSPERDLTPPLPSKKEEVPKKQEESKKEERKIDSDDDLDLILDDIEGILSDDDDSGRFKEKSKKQEPPKPAPAVDLRSKLPPRAAESKRAPRQKIVFHDKDDEKRTRDKTPPKRTTVSSSTKIEDSDNAAKKGSKTKDKLEVSSTKRPRVLFENKEPEKPKEKGDPPKSFSNRRVILQRKISQTKEKSIFARIEVKNDPSKPNPGIFSRAVRTAIGTDNRIVIKKEEPQVEYASDSDIDEDKLLADDLGNTAEVLNLPHGMTDTRLKTLAGSDVQTLTLDKEERTAKITFKTTTAAENFRKKFNNKMVAASRLTVSLR